MATVLVIDDDVALLDVLCLVLEEAGHRVRRATDGVSGLALATEQGVELAVCDVNLPRLDGFSLCRRLREAGSSLPVILLTSRDSEIDEALGLELGADDYLTKPFATRVLLARVAALLRRRQVVSGGPMLTDGALVLDEDRLQARFQGTLLSITVSEFRLLEALVRRRGAVLARAQLLDAVRGDDEGVVDRIIDTYVRRLRRKLEAVDPTFEGIETVIGVGYRWKTAAGG